MSLPSYQLNRISLKYLSACINRILIMLEKHGIDAEEISREANLISLSGAVSANIATWGYYKKLLTYLDESHLIPGIGLRVGEQMQLGDFGILGYASIAAETFGKSIRLGAVNTSLLGWGFGTTFQQCNDNRSEVRIFSLTGEVVPRAINEQWASLCIAGVERKLAGTPELTLAEITIHFPFPQPDYTDLYANVFSTARLQFDSDFCAWSYPTHWNEHRLLSHDPTIESFCIQQLSHLHVRNPDPDLMLEEVNAFIALNSDERVPDMASAAANLNMSVASLRRKLSQCDVTYAKLIEDFRKSKADYFVTNSSLDFKEIAYKLGFSQPSSFFVAFKNWFGCTPKHYRDTHCQHG